MPDTRTTPGDAENTGNKSADLKALCQVAMAQIIALALVLRGLLWASKDAERLIACVYELNLVSALPLEDVWRRLAESLEAVERVVKPRPGVVDQAVSAIHRRNGQRES